VSILVMQVFVSLMLVAAAIAFFVWVVRGRTLEHSDRLALAPLEDDAPPPSPSSSAVDPTTRES
jgi:nitrogen fixation-related uncharacterized protein